jgi:hypothetical protein
MEILFLKLNGRVALERATITMALVTLTLDKNKTYRIPASDVTPNQLSSAGKIRSLTKL